VIRLVLFDIDGTLIATGGAGVHAFERTAASEFGIQRATDTLKFAGRTDTSLIREFFDQQGIPATQVNFRRFQDAYVFWLDHWMGQLPGRVLAGVEPLLTQLKLLPQPPRLGLLTGNIRLGAEIKLRYYQLWTHFEVGAFGDDHECRNQLAAIAHRRSRRLFAKGALGPDEILVIGDTPLDIACARAIQARMLAVATGGTALAELARHDPDWLVSDLGEVDAGRLIHGGN
jgi:phosphoglycolate phosphatase